ncbi:winged helix-turn-helix transcriptional regulator [Dactylosporangium roseum]|uniref:Winged helix-turn-helix transcriptional regulator n=2 Tax=Dactylosporangium roseum TaxID=47989 RepID=A0ABY5ZAY9_9ACTN|nr:metalloregulator ArsR/SmtB family transcription factor [Dactylosporangium roseum]UWZ39263.1 winged helix-turn-helix transcriptional regulator [Dactylosporangium roseum]
MDELLRALAHPARRKLLRLCWRTARPAGALSTALGLAPASTSEHLKVLRKTALLVLHKQGTLRYYQANPARVAQLGAWLLSFDDS